VSKTGDRTFRRTAVKSEYSRAIHDEFVNMFGREDSPRNEGHCKKIWRIQKGRKESPVSGKGVKRKENLLKCAIWRSMAF
jgi:hypothetical protein